MRNPQSIAPNGMYQMSEARIPNRLPDVDAPKGMDQVWQVIDTSGKKNNNNNNGAVGDRHAEDHKR